MLVQLCWCQYNRLVSQMQAPPAACREPAGKLWQQCKVLYVQNLQSTNPAYHGTRQWNLVSRHPDRATGASPAEILQECAARPPAYPWPRPLTWPCTGKQDSSKFKFKFKKGLLPQIHQYLQHTYIQVFCNNEGYWSKKCLLVPQWNVSLTNCHRHRRWL